MSEETKTTAAPEKSEAEARPAATGAASDRKATERPQARGKQGGRGRFTRRRKFCKFCADKSLKIDHKDPDLLRSFVTERYKILPARVTGTCAQHQRRLTTAIKRARILALLAFTPLHHD